MRISQLLLLAASALTTATAHAGIVDVYSCLDLDPAGILKNIELVEGKLATLRSDRATLLDERAKADTDDARAKLDTEIKNVDAQIAALEQKVSDWKTKLAGEKSAIADRIYNGNQCLSYRTDVEALVAKYEAGEPNHSDAITKVKEAIARCSSMR